MTCQKEHVNVEKLFDSSRRRPSLEFASLKSAPPLTWQKIVNQL